VRQPGPITRRREHLDTLCDEHNVLGEYQPKGSTHARAYPEQRQVLIPRTTMIRSYYLTLHEIAHCVLGFDHDRPAALQEAEAWQWAISQSIEPPTPGLKRMMFKALWHYLLSDLGVRGAEDLSNRDLFPALMTRSGAFSRPSTTDHACFTRPRKSPRARALPRIGRRRRTKNWTRNAAVSSRLWSKRVTLRAERSCASSSGFTGRRRRRSPVSASSWDLA
jgi:hypothetical protein